MKRCGTCRWFVPVVEVYNRDDEKARVAGKCDWAEHVEFPYALRFAKQRAVTVYADQGEDCPCHLQCGAETFRQYGFTRYSDENGSAWMRRIQNTEYMIVISNSEGDSAELNFDGDFWVVGIHLEDHVVLDAAETPEEAVTMAEKFEADVSRIH